MKRWHLFCLFRLLFISFNIRWCAICTAKMLLRCDLFDSDKKWALLFLKLESSRTLICHLKWLFAKCLSLAHAIIRTTFVSACCWICTVCERIVSVSVVMLQGKIHRNEKGFVGKKVRDFGLYDIKAFRKSQCVYANIVIVSWLHKAFIFSWISASLTCSTFILVCVH